MLEHEVGLHRKIAFPFVTLVMTLIAVPFAVTTGRRGAMYGIGVGIVLALVYWTMISIFAAFGAGRRDRSDAGGVGAEPDLRRGRGVPAADGPDMSHSRHGASRRGSPIRYVAGMVCLIGAMVALPAGFVQMIRALERGGYGTSSITTRWRGWGSAAGCSGSASRC